MGQLDRDSTRAVLIAVAAKASIAEALAIGAASEKERGRRANSALILKVVEDVREGRAQPGAIEKLGFDPPFIGALLEAPDKTRLSEAAAHALRALSGEKRSIIPTQWIFITLMSAIVMIGMAGLARSYLAPVFAVMPSGLGDPAPMFDVAAWLAMAALFVVFIVALRRAADPLTGVSLLINAAPWLIPLFYGRLEQRARRQLLGTSGVLHMLAAGAAVGLPAQDVLGKLGASAARGDASTVIGVWAGPKSVVARLAKVSYEGESEDAKLVRLARIAAADRPLVDRGWLAVLAGMMLVVVALYIASHALITRIAHLGDTIQ